MNSDRSIEETSEQARWLRSLRDLVQEWLIENKGLQGWVEGRGRKGGPVMKPVPIPTAAYADLIFAFGLAQLGAQAECHELVERARAVLQGADEAHTFLFKAFLFRIGQAREGRPHSGPLAVELMEELEHLYFMLRYMVDRLRNCSRTLEPDRRVDPYRQWINRLDNLHSKLSELTEITNGSEIEARIRKLLATPPQGRHRNPRILILDAALKLAPRVGGTFASEMLDQVLATYDALPVFRKQWETAECAALLTHALFTAAYFNFTDRIPPLIGHLRELAQHSNPAAALEAMAWLAARCSHCLHQRGENDEMDKLLAFLADLVLRGKTLEALIQGINFKKDTPAPLVTLLHQTENWYRQGRHQQAEPLLQEVWTILRDFRFPPLQQRTLVNAFARTVGRLPHMEAQRRFEAIFRELKGISVSFSTADYYNLPMLEVIEAAVLTTAERAHCGWRVDWLD
ncbi:MAG TPA: hypothetical protein VH575_09100 [Gemmataceae bacterium]